MEAHNMKNTSKNSWEIRCYQWDEWVKGTGGSMSQVYNFPGACNYFKMRSFKKRVSLLL